MESVNPRKTFPLISDAPVQMARKRLRITSFFQMANPMATIRGRNPNNPKFVFVI
jgi:hypothetical protein